MTVFRSTTLLIGLCITLSACSDGTGPGTDSRTILLTPISMKLESFDNAGGLLLGTVVVYPTFGSWTWDGVARNATRAQAC